MTKRIVLLGATGSIGQSVLDVVGDHPDRFTIVGLAANSSVEALSTAAIAHPDAKVTLADADARKALSELPQMRPRIVDDGDDSLTALIAATEPDMVVNAMVGFAGMGPTLFAIERGISVALANKETIVTGGNFVLDAARKSGASVLPVDSEHVAIHQCLQGADIDSVRRIVVTASGGALRDRGVGELHAVTVDQVLAHPTWKMGPKITVDCATMANKGLEVIEAHWFFGVPYDNIDVVIHPQSIVHSFVEFTDGSLLAQMGDPDMRGPIAYSLAFPERLDTRQRGDVLGFPDLTFREVDMDRYPSFELALEAARAGGNRPTVFNAANEVAVSAFLSGDIGYRDIATYTEAAMGAVNAAPVTSLDDVIAADRETRSWLARTYTLDNVGIPRV